MIQIKNASPEIYDDMLKKWFFAEPDDLLTQDEKKILELFRLFNNDGQQAIINYVDSLLGIPSLIKEKNNADTSSVSA